MDYWVVIMGARRGWQELAVPHPWKMGNFFYSMGGSFHYFFSPDRGPFSPCGGFFSPYGEPFNEIN